VDAEVLEGGRDVVDFLDARRAAARERAEGILAAWTNEGASSLSDVSDISAAELSLEATLSRADVWALSEWKDKYDDLDVGTAKSLNGEGTLYLLKD